MDNKRIGLTWPGVTLVIFSLFALAVVLIRADMGNEKFYEAAFPWYIMGFVAVGLLLMLAVIVGVAWAMRAVQRSDNANVAEAAKWKAIAEQEKTARAAITNPGRLIEGTAEPVEDAAYEVLGAPSNIGSGATWIG